MVCVVLNQCADEKQCWYCFPEHLLVNVLQWLQLYVIEQVLCRQGFY